MIIIKILIGMVLLGCILYHLYHNRYNGVSLYQNGYFITSSSGLKPHFSVSLDFKTLVPGYLFIYGISDHTIPFSVIFILIDLPGTVTVRKESTAGKETLVDKTVVVDGNWHNLRLTINESTWSLFVDERLTLSTLKTGKNNITSENVYIGGNDDIKNEFLFMGCMRNITFGDEKKDLNFIPSARSKFLGLTENKAISC